MPEGGVKAFSQAEKHIAEIAQLVEHNLAKVGVASSSLVFRSESKVNNGQNQAKPFETMFQWVFSCLLPRHRRTSKSHFRTLWRLRSVTPVRHEPKSGTL